MNYQLLSKFLGYLSFALGILFLPSVFWALWYGELHTIPGILDASLLAWAVGALFYIFGRRAPDDMFQREALAMVAFAWVVSGLLGSLPFICTGTLDPIGAIFESVSGFTTTGASVLDNVEALPKSILFWRSFTHWLGGIGIVVMFIAVLPYLGAGGKHLFKTESTGPDARGLRPRIKESAAILLYIYLALTCTIVLAYLLTGQMGLFDALCNTFGALATGGFSTRNHSIAAYHSVSVEFVSILSMIAGGSCFSLYYYTVKERHFSFIHDAEWRVFISLLALCSILVALNVSGYIGFKSLPEDPAVQPPAQVVHSSLHHAIRASTFAVTSIMTNTGFVTDDFDHWPYFSRMMLILLMFIGGCAGSTSGGIKVTRFIMVVKLLYYRLERTFRPKTIRAVRISGEVVSAEKLQDAYTFVMAYLVFFAFCSLVMSLLGIPFESATSAVASCMSNTGPGLELVGATESYSALPQTGLAFLAGCMILGRLEIFTFAVLFVPDFWRIRRR